MKQPITAEIKAELRSADSAGYDRKTPTFCERGMASEWNLTQHAIVTPEGGEAGPYLCDVRTDGGGWIVLQHRQAGNVTFNRPWKDFKEGFGPLTGDFWLGNERIHQLTSRGLWELQVEFRHQEKLYQARYDSFRLGGESSKYRLHIGAFSSDDGLRDDLRGLDGAEFLTPDSDTSVNCAVTLGAAWWYPSSIISSSSVGTPSDGVRSCAANTAANLNLPWRSSRESAFWRSATAHSGFVTSVSGYSFSSSAGDDVQMTEMKIRRLA